MLFSLLSGDIQTAIVNLLLSLPIILLSLTIHEVAHGYVAYKCGDRTAYNLGRLTLNPLKHLDPIGVVCMLIFGYGWAKPVPVNTRNFDNPKKGMAITAAAGPLANLIMGVLSAVLYGFFTVFHVYLFYTAGGSFITTCIEIVSTLCLLGALYNFMFMAFNLIPIPPFDGSRLALAFLPPRTYFKLMQYERQIMFGMLIALLVLSRLGFSPFSWIANELTQLIATPVINGFWAIFEPLILNSL